jgi:hypothetical protein
VLPPDRSGLGGYDGSGGLIIVEGGPVGATRKVDRASGGLGGGERPLGEMIRVLPGQVFALERSSTALCDHGRVIAPAQAIGSTARHERLWGPGGFAAHNRRMPLLTLGQAIAAKVRLIVWCKARQHRFEPDIAEFAQEHGEKITVLAWARRLCCSHCGARDADFVVSGTKG